MKFTQRTMTKRQALLVVVVFLVVLAGALGLAKKYQSAYRTINKQAFRENFRESFLTACYGGSRSEELNKSCDCVANMAVYELSIAQLRDEDFMRTYVDEKVNLVCKFVE